MTLATLDEVLDEFLADLSDDTVRPCKVRRVDPFGGLAEPWCPGVAVVWIECRTCRVGAACCERHRRNLVDDPYVECPRCGTVGSGVAVFSFEPLGGGDE